MLTSLLPPSVCASCRLCCNFLPESRWELPALEPVCFELLQEQGVPLVPRAESGWTFQLPEMPSDAPQKAVNCPLLDCSRGCSLPRSQRPLECRLWPLRLMRDAAGTVVVACYQACPGLESVPRGTLLEFARSLRPVFVERARTMPESIRPLHPNYVVLFELVDEGELWKKIASVPSVVGEPRSPK